MTCFNLCFRKNASSPTKRALEFTEELSGVENLKRYSYNELKIATKDFSPSNKLGQGGFGTVYKGKLKDGTLAAMKVLSTESSQGLWEFLTEIIVISDIEHENLVKLLGCCAEGNHRILVYGYLENNSLAHNLLGNEPSSIQFSWKTRAKICIGVARGLTYLHEEVRPRIVHRDIKASNVLLDKDFTPKISDFGLAKLFPPNVSHISTRVAGTLGYLAPEYAIRGQLTKKADIYSFGILLLEIVCGRCNISKEITEDEPYLLERAWELYEAGELVGLVDRSLEGDFDVDEACRFLKIGLRCTQEMPKTRPSMSTVVKLLTGEVDVDDSTLIKPGLISELLCLKKQKNRTLHTLSSGIGKLDNSSSSRNTFMSVATMTFTSMYDRRN